MAIYDSGRRDDGRVTALFKTLNLLEGARDSCVAVDGGNLVCSRARVYYPRSKSVADFIYPPSGVWALGISLAISPKPSGYGRLW